MEKNIIVPLSKEDWTNPSTKYVFDKDRNFGIWEGTKGDKVYAPEDGELETEPDGLWILIGKNGGQREWLSTSRVVGMGAKYPSKTRVKAGEELGVLDEDLRLAVGLTALKDIGVAGVKPVWKDPVALLQDPEVAAQFIDFRAEAPRGEMVPAGQPAGGGVLAAPPGAGIQVTSGTAFWGGVVVGGLAVLLVAAAVK